MPSIAIISDRPPGRGTGRTRNKTGVIRSQTGGEYLSASGTTDG
jgi:hypothetical protein